jgi:hypothetical protein
MFLILEDMWRKLKTFLSFEEKHFHQKNVHPKFKKMFFSHQISFFLLKVFFLRRKCKKIVKMFYLKFSPIQIIGKSALIPGFPFSICMGILGFVTIPYMI